MLRFLKYLPLLFIGILHAQEEVVHSVYFQFDKFSLKPEQLDEVVKFIRTADSARIETIEIFAFMEAADESKRQGGAVVALESMLQKAKKS